MGLVGTTGGLDDIDKNKKLISDTSKVGHIEKLEKYVESFKKSLENG